MDGTRHLPDRHVTVTHAAPTVRRTDAPTGHRPLRWANAVAWIVGWGT
ncbi:hypothetical protein EHYA_03476 [Embleya hyalina]|uniref:Uncharacterized protein n=1 Tax=Embleya hyalina TaxID=516124 RepID=A0A401YME0_9ACTN|nr:hypothetical protein EHYA_03476 [Embleya hyalina]